MSFLTPVKVPRELLAVNQTALEDYVRSRFLQLVRGLGQRLLQLAPGTNPAVLDRAVRDVIDILPLPDYGLVPVEMLELQLLFRHDCLALGCTEPQCVLCQHNSQRRCTVNFNKKYLVNDKMVARCGAQIRIEVVERATGKLYDGDMPEVYIELFILDGAQYDQKFLGEKGRAYHAAGAAGAEQPDAELDDCALLLNNKSTPLIASLTGGRADDLGRLILQTQHGRLVLPDVVITDSSEALLSGRKPPFRLVARARHVEGHKLKMRHAVSEPFVVATRRVRASHKVEIPSMDDPVSKLDHMGRETVRKLADLPAAAAQAGVTLALEPELHRVEKVKHFKALALKAQAEGHLRQQLQALLKLPKDKWEEAAEHAKRAVVPDNRQRAWYADRTNMDLGLLFPCRLGVVDLKRPEALLQRSVDASGASKVEVVVQTRQSPMQRDIVRQLLPQAEASWWAPGHVGWTIFAEEVDADSLQGAMNTHTVFKLPTVDGASDLTHTAMNAAAAAAAAQPVATCEDDLPGPVGMQFFGAANTRARDLLSQQHHGQRSAPQLLPPVAGLDLHGMLAAHAVATGAMSTAAAAPGAAPMATDGPEYMPLELPASHAVAAAAAAAAGGTDMLSLEHINALMLSAAATGAPAAAEAVATAAAAANRMEHGALLCQPQQQQQRPETWQQQVEPPQQLASFVLPSSAELELMMQSRSLTEEVVAQITAAYEANACPPDILAVLHSHITHEATGQDHGTPSAAPDNNACNANRSGGNGGLSSPTAGLKRTRSAAAFSSNSTGGRSSSSGGAGGPPGAGGASNVHLRAAAAPGIVQQDSFTGHVVKRPASFSGGAGAGRSTSMSEAAAAAAGRRPASVSLPPTRAQQLQLQQLEAELAAEEAAAAAGEEPHPFFEQLRRDSTRTSPAAAAAAAAAASTSASPPSSFEAAADEAARAVEAADAAAAAAADRGSSGATASAAEAVQGRSSGHSNSGVDSVPATVRPDAASNVPTDLLPGQSLDVPGLCAAYPSVMLDALVASAAASRGAAGTTGSNGLASAAVRAGARVSRADSGTVQPDMEVLLEGAGLEQLHMAAKQATALPLKSLSSLGLLDSSDVVVGASSRAAAAAGDGSSSVGHSNGKPQLSNRTSAELMDAMSLELPSGLLQLNSLLDCKTSLQPQSSLLAAFGKSLTGSGLAGLKLSCLELPSSLLNFRNSNAPDAVGQKDAGPTAAAAGAPEAAQPAVPSAAAAAGKSTAAGAAAAAATAEGSNGLGSKASSGILGWDRLGSLGNSAGLQFLISNSTGSGSRAVRKESGLDVIVDMGQALDEIMSAEQMQP